MEFADNGVIVGSMEVNCEGEEESRKECESLEDKVIPIGVPVFEGTNDVSVLGVKNGAAVG